MIFFFLPLQFKTRENMGEPRENRPPFKDLSQIPIPPLVREKSTEFLEIALQDAPNFIGIPSLMLLVNPDERREVVHALTHLAILYKREDELIEWTLEEALERCERPEVAFRDNSVFTIVLAEYLRVKGASVARDLFAEIVARVERCPDLLDITRTAIIDEDARESYHSNAEQERVTANAKRIRENVTSICEVIYESVEKFGRALGPVFPLLERQIKEHTAQDDQLKHDSFIGLFFLRYICIGLTCVLDWGILPQERKSKASQIKGSTKIVYHENVFRNMNIISKVVQKIASSTEFPEWNDYSVFNADIKAMGEKTQRFMCDMFAKTNLVWPKPEKPDEREITRNQRLVLDYIAKSGPQRLMEFKQQIIAVAFKIYDRKGDWESPGYDQMKIGATYMYICSLFVNKRVIRGYLKTQGKRARVQEKKDKKASARLGKKKPSVKDRASAMAKSVSGRVLNMPLVRRKDAPDDSDFKYDSEATYKQLVAGKKLVVIVFYRGQWCPYCNSNLQGWSEQTELIEKTYNGILLGISSQDPDLAQQTAKDWNVNFPLLGDPENVLARKWGIEVSRNRDINNGDYPFGMAQPAVIILDENLQQLYFWASEPRKDNLQSATDRPVPAMLMHELRQRLFGLKHSDSVDMSLSTSLEEEEDDTESALHKVLECAERDADYARRIIEELAKSKQNRTLFHKVRKQYRNAH